MSPKEPEWKQFEMAVAAFVAALDPAAKVLHNVRLPDRHHRGQRQRDVWIEARISGHFPVSVLVSCKRYKRKLHSGDIDAFTGELASSHARVGVIYSYSGFYKPAIEKARALGIACCRLFQGDPPEIPAVLFFTAYCCSPQIALALSPYPAEGWALGTWKDVFNLRVKTAEGESCLLDELVAEYHEAEKSAVGAFASGLQAPEPFRVELAVQPDAGARPIRLVATGRWKFYRAKLEAYEVNGSYEFTRGDFKGGIAIPFIDPRSSEPGLGWELIDKPPTEAAGMAMMIVLHRGNVRDALLETMGPKAIKGGN